MTKKSFYMPLHDTHHFAHCSVTHYQSYSSMSLKATSDVGIFQVLVTGSCSVEMTAALIIPSGDPVVKSQTKINVFRSPSRVMKPQGIVVPTRRSPCGVCWLRAPLTCYPVAADGRFRRRSSNPPAVPFCTATQTSLC